MYTATMVYKVKEDAMEEFSALWEDRILQLASRQRGFVRMQLLVRKGEAMALGTWEDRKHAQAFMALGAFKNLMEAAGPLVSGHPRPTIWSLGAFAEC